MAPHARNAARRLFVVLSVASGRLVYLQLSFCGPVRARRMFGALRRSAWLGWQRSHQHTVRGTAAGVANKAVPTTAVGDGRGKEYPSVPRVGIGVLILRKVEQQPQVLLIRRGCEPQKGRLSFPGGTMELGETMASCAVREALEETGLQLRNEPPGAEIDPRSLAFPRPVDAVDSLHRDSDGRVQFHYTIVDLAAVPEDLSAVPVAADDADQVIWTPVDELDGLPDLVPHCARIAREAVQRFDIPDH